MLAAYLCIALPPNVSHRLQMDYLCEHVIHHTECLLYLCLLLYPCVLAAVGLSVWTIPSLCKLLIHYKLIPFTPDEAPVSKSTETISHHTGAPSLRPPPLLRKLKVYSTGKHPVPVLTSEEWIYCIDLAIGCIWTFWCISCMSPRASFVIQIKRWLSFLQVDGGGSRTSCGNNKRSQFYLSKIY